MNYTKIIQSILIILILTLSAIIHASKKTSSDVGDFYNEDKRNIFVSANNPVFTLKLKSNPTTGYAWFLRDYDENLIRPMQQTFEKPDQALIGAPGYEVWTFSVKPDAFAVPQQTTIKMIYARPWQMDGGTSMVFQVTIQGKK